MEMEPSLPKSEVLQPGTDCRFTTSTLVLEAQRDRLGFNDNIEPDDEGDGEGESTQPPEEQTAALRPLNARERAACYSLNDDLTDGKLPLVRSRFSSHHFSIVICDEGHVLKNADSKAHQLVADIQKDALLICTATPMLNHPADNLSYLRFGFSWLPEIPWLPDDLDINSLYAPEFDIDREVLAQQLNAYFQEFSPRFSIQRTLSPTTTNSASSFWLMPRAQSDI
ncbi:uncharacterized protein E0L32_002361 [Thyridium curvatum]|uniref:SNF2 N-terminal domain-containing protein n=1 Tax=Thyridium curvatum TaxID=1093900 RepID=A0A507AD52_9PEZI|nr:uncharacterized protein E0L32_002361 [Thyridium curvatum]TPX06865.1 hypothetical protein E0L32_002361 [Thyridium curvatum]